MKKTLFAIIALLLVITACDKMEDTHYVADDTITVDVEFPALDASSVHRKILIEEFTGHKCTNCPSAHDRLKVLLDQSGGSLIAICIHAGYLARTDPPDYPTDYTTQVGSQLYSDFGISSVPNAIVNRTQYQNKWGLLPDSWANAIDAIDRTKVSAAVQIINDYNDSYQRLRTYIKTSMLEDYDESLSLSLFLIEEGIISPQLRGSTRIVDYEHSHVLRLGINGTYGKPLTLDGDLIKDSTYSVGYEVRFANKDWKPENCYVVAVLINPATKEVIQVEKCKVK